VPIPTGLPLEDERELHMKSLRLFHWERRFLFGEAAVSKTTFTQKLLHFSHTYDSLLALAETYPSSLRLKAGACGSWTPQQVLMHFTGWLTEATRRYRQFNAGVPGNMNYNFDTFNARNIEARARQTWDDTLDELRDTLDEFTALASVVSSEQASADPRYAEWLDELARDCATHTEQLQQFASEAAR
jgi:hypothetical protein